MQFQTSHKMTRRLPCYVFVSFAVVHGRLIDCEMTQKGQGRDPREVKANIFGPIISITAGHTDLVPMEHLYEIATRE